MSTEFKLPEVSEGVETADVAEILVAVGDVIAADQIIMELETDKAVVELPCPHAGRIEQIHVSVGDTVPIGGALLTIELETTAEATSKAPATKKTNAKSKKVAVSDGAATSSKKSPAPAPVSAPVAQNKSSQTENADDDQDRPPAPAGPATRRLARELGVDLYQVQGTGPGGRITAENVQAYVRTLTSTAVGSGPMMAPPLPDFSKFGPVERRSMSKIAKTSAASLSRSWQVIPHVTQHDLVDITEVEAARRRYLQTRTGQAGPKITMTAIVIKAVVSTLKTFPNFNASLDPQTDELVLKQYYHIGCAVDTPNGLLVPVVRDVDQKSIIQVATELTDLATRARERKLGIDAMQGATFTITNLGGIGGTGFTPIVNYPEVAILGLSRSRTELQLRDDELVERLLMPLSLSYDHRVVNGADAARFVSQLAHGLSDIFEFWIHS